MAQTEDRKLHFERPTAHKQSFPTARRFLFLLAIVGVSICSGLLGYILISVVLAPQVPLYLPFASSVTEPLRSDPVVYPVRYDDRSLSVGVLLEDSAPSETGTVYDVLVNPELVIGQVVAMTSDGWFVGHVGRVTAEAHEVFLAGQRYPVAEVRYDAFSGLSFFKIAAASAPVTISRSLVTRPVGVTSAALTMVPGISFVQGIASPAQYQVVEVQGDYVKNAGELPATTVFSGINGHAGTPFFNSSGELIGVDRGVAGELIPAWEVAYAFERILTGQEYLDPGFFYVEAYAPLIAERDAGAHVMNPVAPPVVRNGLAAGAGLLAGDVVQSIEGERLTAATPFAYLWGKYQAQDQLRISVLRDGAIHELTIVRGR